MAKPYTLAEIRFIKDNYLHMWDYDIAAMLNRSHQAIRSARLRYGLMGNKAVAYPPRKKNYRNI
jgi:hypothetical protein